MDELKLNPGERSILASFEDGVKAESAAAELKQAGYGEVQVDRIDGYAGGPNANDNARPTLGEASQVTASFTGTGTMLDDDARVLMAAMPEVSGMSGAPAQIVPPFLVTVVTSSARAQAAVQTIQKHGGRV